VVFKRPQLRKNIIDKKKGMGKKKREDLKGNGPDEGEGLSPFGKQGSIAQKFGGKTA